LTSRALQMLVCKPAAARDDFADPELPGWTAGNSAIISCDCDLLRVQSDGAQNYGFAQKIGLSVDASKYKYLIIRVKGDGSFWGEVYDG